LGSIHGGMPAAMRHEVVRQFQGGHLDVLVATDTAGEGLNLHQQCRLVIDLELPWNPLRLEQRVGRVDRLGQQRRVHAVHLMQRGTIEATVWRHLEDRRQRAGHALDDWSPATDDDVARAVFDDRPLPEPVSRHMASTHVDDSAAEAARIAMQRRLLRRPAAVSERCVFASPQRHRLPGDAIVLVEDTRLGPMGGMIERRVRAFQLDASCCSNSVEAWREMAANAGTWIGQAAEPVLQPTRDRLLARIEAARLRLATARALHQASLFDRRAELAARARTDVAIQIGRALRRREATLTLGGPLNSHQRLVAVWPRRRKP
jgi:hypothetical protein